MGFFTVEEVGAFTRAVQTGVEFIGCRSGEWHHLCDVTELKLQSQDVTEAIYRFVNDPPLRSRKLAIVAGKSPVRMQIRRLLTRADGMLFEEMEDAERWLFEDIAPSAPVAMDARPGL